MSIWFHIVCGLIAVGWLLQAWVSWFEVMQLARKFRTKVRPLRDEYRPPVTIIMPIKGVDKDLPGCIQGLCTQAYPDYRVIIVLESNDDPARPILDVELARFPERSSTIMIAGRAPNNVGQKVHNQLHVIDQIEPTADDEDVWVFADSDAIPGPTWLVDLVTVLVSKHKYAVASGYRWLVPEPATNDSDEQQHNAPSNFWANVASVINSSVACAYRRGDNDLAWGGAMAMRVAIVRQGKLRERLIGSLTDDYSVTTMCRDLNLRVRFVRSCLAPTPVKFTFRSLVEFARRQYLITRIYAPRMYYAALAVLTFWWVGLITAWFHLVMTLKYHSNSYWWIMSGYCIVSVFVSHQLRAGRRKLIVARAFGDDMVNTLRPALLTDRWLTPVWMFTHWLVVVAALFGNRFTWRGIRYQLRGPQDVERFDDDR